MAWDRTHSRPPTKLALIKGGAAGDHTLTGITTADAIDSVWKQVWDTDGDIATVSDLTSEFTISAANTINNTGGTGSTDACLIVLWSDYNA